MGTYRNPTLLKGYTNPVSKNKSYGGVSVSEMQRVQGAEAKAARRMEAANWEIYKKEKQNDAEKRISLEKAIVGGSEKDDPSSSVVDIQSLRSNLAIMADNQSDAKIRLETSQGYYEGMDADIAMVNNGAMSIAQLPEQFGAYHNMMQELSESNMGYEEGGINPGSLNPYLKIASGIASKTSGISGKISYRSKYSQDKGTEWEIVLGGESVKALNKNLYEDSKDPKYKSEEYVFNLSDIYNNMNDNDGNPYVVGVNTYTKTPALNTPETIEELKDRGILNSDNLLQSQYLQETQVIEDNKVYDVKSPDVNKVDMAIGVEAETFTRVAGESPVAWRNWVQSLARKRGTNVRLEETESETQIFFTPFLRDDETNELVLDSKGLAQLGEEYQVGDNGFLEQNPGSETATTLNYDKGTWDRMNNMSRDQLIISNGFNNVAGRELNSVATNALQKRIDAKNSPIKLTAGERKNITNINDIKQTIESYKESLSNNELNTEQKLSILSGLNRNGKFFKPVGDKGIGSIFSYKAGEGDKDVLIAENVDVNTARGLNEVIRAFGLTLTDDLVNAEAVEVKDKGGQSPAQAQANAEREIEKNVEVALKKYNEEEKENTFRPGVEESFVESFEDKEGIKLLKKLGIKELTVSNSFFNQVEAVGIDDKVLETFDPKTSAGRDKWEAIVRKQLSKGKVEPKPSVRFDASGNIIK